MFVLSSTSKGLEFWSVNNTSVYENSESKVLENKRFLGETSKNWPNLLLGTNECLQDSWILLIITIKNIPVY